MVQRSTTPKPMEILFILLLVVVVFQAQPTEGQYYCNGRAAITQQWGGCNATTAVCSNLMQAITTTWNWWNTTNNTAGNSLGVAVHNFFTTDAYGQLLSITNNNTAYPNVCTKIAKIVAQLLVWNATKDANVLLGNATHVATARQELFNTVVPGWGYTIGQYIACGPTCTNYTSTTSTTSTISTTSTTGTTSTISTTSTTTSTTTPSTTTTSAETSTTEACPCSQSNVSFVLPNSVTAIKATTTGIVNSGGGVCTLPVTCEQGGYVLCADDYKVFLAIPASDTSIVSSALNCVSGQWLSPSTSSPANTVVTDVFCDSFG